MVDDAQVADDDRRAADGAVPADVGAAGDAGAAGDGGVRADPHVVADLDLVVELDAVLDHRVIDRAAVDGGIGADLDVIADAHRADLRHLDAASVLIGNAEAISADQGAGMDDDAASQAALRVDHHARVEASLLAKARALADHAAGADRHARAKLGALRDDGGGVHARWLRDERIEELRDTGEVGIGIIRDDARPRRLAFGLGAEDHGAGARRGELRAVAPTGKEADVLGRGAFERSDLVHHRFGIAGDAAGPGMPDLYRVGPGDHRLDRPAVHPD